MNLINECNYIDTDVVLVPKPVTSEEATYNWDWRSEDSERSREEQKQYCAHIINLYVDHSPLPQFQGK